MSGSGLGAKRVMLRRLELSRDGSLLNNSILSGMDRSRLGAKRMIHSTMVCWGTKAAPDAAKRTVCLMVAYSAALTDQDK